MDYIFEEGQAHGKRLVLLHGTGGDENSLVDVARFLDDSGTILSFRGNIQEDGMNRFFKRNGLNQFDIPNLEEETDHLLAEITQHSEKTGIPLEDWVLIGYSNGANIAAHLLLERETALKNAILLHPMSLGVATKDFSLADKNVWLSFGQGDPIVSEASFDELKDNFKKREAFLTTVYTPSGHQVTMDELNNAKDWLNQLN